MYIDSKQKKESIFSAYGHMLLTLAIATTCLSLAFVFPAQKGLQEMTKYLFFLFVIPVLYIRYILKKNPADFGLNIQNKKAGIIYGLLALVFYLGIFYALSNYSDFRDNYALPGYILENFWYFVIYELIFINFFLFLYEFFFRGFIMFALKPKIGAWAIILQVIIFYFSLVITKGFSWQSAPMIIFTLVSGIISYKSQSIVYSYAVALLFMVIFDSFVVYSIK